MSETSPPPEARKLSRAGRLVVWSIALIPVNAIVLAIGLTTHASDLLLGVFVGIAFLQAVLGVAAVVAGVRGKRAGRNTDRPIVFGVLSALGAIGGGFIGFVAFAFHDFMSGGFGGGGFGGGGFGGGAWGRPLRVRGRQLHPSLTEGADWTLGARPDPSGLDGATARLLEALWLHDAQKEHASVPAFTRVAWLLAAAGAPAELLTWSHRAAIEEVEHTQACFALAAGYGRRSFTVEPMPELLLGGLDGTVDPRIMLAVESLTDGCQLEDFNADVAAACAEACVEPVTRSVLERIAREERTHADFSWAVLGWLLDRHREVVVAPLEGALASLDAYPRPTAVADDKGALLAGVDEAQLRAHGRLPDARWAELWAARLVLTSRRIASMLVTAPLAAAA